MATPTFDVLAFLKSVPEAERVDGQLLLGPFTIPAYQVGEPVSIEREPGLSCLGYALRPTSEGSLEITSADPDAALLLDPNYLTTDYDRTTTANLLRRTRELFAAVTDRRSNQSRDVPRSGSAIRRRDRRLRAGRWLHRLPRRGQLRDGPE